MSDGFEIAYGQFPDDLEFFASVAMNGIFYITKNEKKLVSQKERPYGITYDRYKKCWLYAGGFDGEFIHFDKSGEKEKFNLNIHDFYNVHQIDFIEDDLYVTVGGKGGRYNRSIIVLDKNFKVKEKFKPFPKEHSHMNSIFMYNDIIYVVAHNKTWYTGLASQVGELDRNHRVIRVRDNMGHSSHNFYTNGKEDFWCNSYNNALIRNRKVFFKADRDDLLRGLAISDKYIVVGGSKLHPNSIHRVGKSKIYILDRTGDLLCKLNITLPSFILEIRHSNPLCLTMTNTHL